MAGNGRVLTKDLDARLRIVEEKLAEIARRLSQPGVNANGADDAVHLPPEGQDKVARLEAMVMRLDERVEKITATLVEQASRWS